MTPKIVVTATLPFMTSGGRIIGIINAEISCELDNPKPASNMYDNMVFTEKVEKMINILMQKIDKD